MDKILFIDNLKIFDKWASKTYPYKIEQIKKSSKFDFIDVSDDTPQPIENYKIVVFGWNATLISKYYTTKHNFYSKKISNLENSESIKSKIDKFLDHPNKYLVTQDLHQYDYENGINGLINYLSKYRFKGIISPYKNATAMPIIIKSLPNLRIIDIPHHIDETKFKDWKLEKKYDIFLFGNTSVTAYPFRNRLMKLLEKNKNRYKIIIWKPIRNYFRYDSRISNDSLSKMINRSLITICTSSSYNMLLGKYFETSMSKSLIAGNMPEDGVNIWKDNYLHLDPTDSNREILLKLDIALKDRISFNNKIENAYENMRSFYLSKFADHLYVYLMNL
ncbi:MAG: hypothetical protein CMF62_02015 [Magnetococcales bacterium]|nr:hypothetical protein [Magnetococcales bacterium]|tara:strand:+ start:137025 stop:138023 length:999 start_codon:yes stop_codon:yes gene_type:complete